MNSYPIIFKLLMRRDNLLKLEKNSHDSDVIVINHSGREILDNESHYVCVFYDGQWYDGKIRRLPLSLRLVKDEYIIDLLGVIKSTQHIDALNDFIIKT